MSKGAIKASSLTAGFQAFLTTKHHPPTTALLLPFPCSQPSRLVVLTPDHSSLIAIRTHHPMPFCETVKL